jgi:hypothetical protein
MGLTRFAITTLNGLSVGCLSQVLPRGRQILSHVDKMEGGITKGCSRRFVHWVQALIDRGALGVEQFLAVCERARVDVDTDRIVSLLTQPQHELAAPTSPIKDGKGSPGHSES